MSEFSGWDAHRRIDGDGTIDLLSVFEEVTRTDNITPEERKHAIIYVWDIELMQRIRSRQAAAVVIATLRMHIRVERTRE